LLEPKVIVTDSAADMISNCTRRTV